MNIRMMMTAGLVLALGGCATTAGTPRDPIEARWNGQQAGVFFAKFGPPVADVGDGDNTIYTWRGGYKTARIPAKYAEGEGGKKGKQMTAARTAYLRCEVKLTVDSGYVIRHVQTVADRPGISGPSYCAEFLAPEEN
ncbi:hypothetical protein MRS76_05395 [Rhizobiaceae bacterium n13]|uniref:Lipoprotein n=1 Tax=Ferirhizobium litorale TaxID=2927786 RepID=A0AAE3QDG3_9HYPH|nr:hypothetical protein [Fererhizobium litorale]MDI7861383.1 hypothetical protein [Fererhizobium litorale]MDI7921530.1 hypothetical protein [Fererhizobium litorale]